MTRVLPWRRRPREVVGETSALLTEYRAHHPGADSSMIEQAYQVALAAHAGQTRKSGEPYIHHPLSVATIVARQGLDDVTVAAALLHDAVEDTSISLDDLERDSVPMSGSSWTASPSWSASTSTPAKNSRRPASARCWSPWPRTFVC